MSLLISELIHPSAIISVEAELAADVQVGPYTIIEGPVRVGPGTVIEGHVCLSGPLIMGRDNFVGHGAVLGKSPQHRNYQGEMTTLLIGDANIFREHVTINRGTPAGGGRTSIGNRNMFMIGSHVGHDGIVGNDCILTNGALVAGHAELQDNCILSGHAAVQQRVRIGRLAMLGGLGSTTKDLPPFVLAQGYNCVSGLNLIGLRRSGMTSDAINAIRQAFRILYKEGRTLTGALELIVRDLGSVPEIVEFVDFIRSSTVGISPARDNGRSSRSF